MYDVNSADPTPILLKGQEVGDFWSIALIDPMVIFAFIISGV
jgi:hypothetical protein